MPPKPAATKLTTPGNSASERVWTIVLSACVGVGVVVVLNLIGPLQIKSYAQEGEMVRVDLSRILVDWEYYQSPDGTQVNRRNPISVQSFMWIAFSIGFGELWLRRRAYRHEYAAITAGLLPEDESSLIHADDLKPIYIKARGFSRTAVLPILVRRLTMEFRKSKSIERANALLDSSLTLFQHRADLNYTLLRYLVWVIPTLGFIGTVIGIASAMGFAGSGVVAAEDLLTPTTQRLAVAFYTTLLALLQSGVLVLGMSLMQAKEESVINDAGQYCLENLIMKLMQPDQLESIRAGKS